MKNVILVLMYLVLGFFITSCGITLRVQSSLPVLDECRGADLYHGEKIKVFRARSCAGEK